MRHGLCASGSCTTGGGIHNAGTLTLSGSTVSGNSAVLGGGIYSQGVLDVTGSTCSGNTAGEDGGGIYNDGGTATVIDSTVSGNVAFSAGAGILNVAGTLIVADSTLSENSGSVDGGGIFSGNDSTLSVTNSTLSGNSAAFHGGVLINGGTATVSNTTVTGNAAQFEGGGIHGGASGSLMLSRSLVAGNLAFGSGGVKGDGSEIFDSNGSITADDFNVLGHDLLSDDEAFFDFTPGASDRTATSDGSDPTTLAAIRGSLDDNGGPICTHALSSGSPAIDFGPSADCAPTTAVDGLDQRGDARGVDVPGTGNDGGTHLCDSGAYEAQPPAAVPISPWADLVIVSLLATIGCTATKSLGSARRGAS